MQPADNNTSARPRVLPVPVRRPGIREVTREEIEEAADHYYRMVADDDDYADCYSVSDDVPDGDIYITAAFRCSFGTQAYLFMGREYVLLNYDPPTTLDGGVLEGPESICKGIPSLYHTVFAEYGIDAAFGLHHRNEAFIFSGNTCARIAYKEGSSDFNILEGPAAITKIFPFLRKNSFGSAVDAAFESSTDNEAYLFLDNQYIIINYEDRSLVADKQTLDCLKGTVFESGIDAAFASHIAGEAYIFKEDSYALLNFDGQCIIGDVKKILPDNCPSLSNVLPRKNVTYEDEFVIYPIGSDESDGYYPGVD